MRNVPILLLVVIALVYLSGTNPTTAEFTTPRILPALCNNYFPISCGALSRTRLIIPSTSLSALVGTPADNGRDCPCCTRTSSTPNRLAMRLSAHPGNHRERPHLTLNPELRFPI